MLSVIAMTIVIFFHGRVIKVEGDLSLTHMMCLDVMCLALAEIAHLTLGYFFFLFICSQSCESASSELLPPHCFLADNVILY